MKAKKKYSHLIGRWVWCRWIDATRVDLDNLDAFLESNEGKYNNYCKYKQMAGLFEAEDQYVIVINPIFDEKNPNLPPDQRSASLEQVPKEWVLQIRELDFV